MSDEDYLLRYWLWRCHNPSHLLYGDDGELQCSTCGLDFKRDSAEVIDSRLQQNYTEWLIEHADEIRAAMDKQRVS